MRFIQGLADIVSSNQYTIIASDVYGVLHDGVEPYPYSRVCLKSLCECNLETILLSNSSRLGHVLADDLESKYGIDKSSYKRVLSSGDVTRQFLQSCFDQIRGSSNEPFNNNKAIDCSATMLFKNESLMLSAQEFTQQYIKTGRFHLIGNASYHGPLYKDLAPEIIPVSLDCQDIDFVLVGLIISLPRHGNPVNPNDANNVRQHYHSYLQQCLLKNIPMIIANPDIRAPNGSNTDGTPRLLMCPGYIGELYREMGGKVLYFGKPFATIYRYLLSDTNHDSEVRKVLCIGDNLSTDVLGARKADLDVVLILGGVHNVSVGNGNDFVSSIEQLCLQYESPEPTYAMEYLRF
ncbi:HAD-like domain-containing protein [Phascolomyces articulosus]|uniref:HAD-like domain-containing protein n=1 Tax=Phascolomyces articulosus TaxID=60185 RepID=A0AAD5KIX1_9FUNG|nr:HAD-like domain-containing protein [Phascolomyces articulosus]